MDKDFKKNVKNVLFVFVLFVCYVILFGHLLVSYGTKM